MKHIKREKQLRFFQRGTSVKVRYKFKFGSIPIMMKMMLYIANLIFLAETALKKVGIMRMKKSRCPMK